ncbi:hypothetical protein [Hymenobacter pini]|uniref:hypothetical protein n=1 Tax=Hymenobacter pini TaxID=2880879 RepID=UPI001CF23F3E|nr:hypothetical protein [Hymenobacter pini]MCA8829085.1 hypothetical protein [Hymenobacter pini]
MTLTSCQSLWPSTATVSLFNLAPEEIFIDSVNVGRKGANRVDILKYKTNDSIYVVVNFYSKNNNTWRLMNEYVFEKDYLSGINPVISDFDNDGLNDVTYVSDVAARGSNEIRRLFIYRRESNDLISVKNSELYPNMLYNKKLNCIDAFLMHGGCTTVFLKLVNDSLKATASVDLLDSVYIKTYDEEGREKSKIVRAAGDDEFIRYKNFNPLEEY